MFKGPWGNITTPGNKNHGVWDFSPGVQYHRPPMPGAFQAAVYQGISGSLRECVPQRLLLPAQGLRGSFQTYILPGLNSPRGAAPWIIAFLAAVAYGWELLRKGCSPQACLVYPPHWDRQGATIFPSIIIDRVAGKCFLAFSADSEVSLLTRRFSDTHHPRSLRGRVGCPLMVVWCCSHGQAAR